MSRLAVIAAGGLLLGRLPWAAAEPFTPIHEAGRCAFRDHCGSKSFFGGQLPCLDNGPAEHPDEKLREQLVELCGPKWNSGPVCCTADQVSTLKKSLATAYQVISSCPACQDNFYNMFCTFTCSPDQSLFVNVTDTLVKNGKTLVAEMDQLISAPYGTGFYDSCKEVKFGPTNSRAMDLIGGGAQNYSLMLNFLGKERLGGSPFQINFPLEYHEAGMQALPMTPKKCNDDDANFRCACVDCPAVCPELPAVQDATSCHVGLLPCLSFASIFSYSMLLLAFVLGIGGRVAWRRHAQGRSERLRLLTDAAPSDDEEDEGNLDQARPVVVRYAVNTWCDVAFSKLGHVAARFPAITISTCLLVVLALSLGWVRFQIETDPARLWVSPTSAAAQEKGFFDETFGPFYRAEKIFLVNDSLPTGPGPVLSQETLVWWMGVEAGVKALRGPQFGTTFPDVCYKPTGSACAVQSVSAYFQDDARMVDSNWKDTIRKCAQSPVECRAKYGQPIEPAMIFGGQASADVTEASAMTVTWVLSNHAEGSNELSRAMDWETAIKERLLEVQVEARQRGLRMSFSTEISLEEELNKSTNTDAKIIVISYIIMFLYASIALGSTTLSWKDFLRNPALSLVESKFTLGVVGILIVLMSIAASIGLFSWAGLKATLIIIDVIPFIVLAVGVDNIFLIVHEFERVNVSHADEAVEARVAKALGRMGPSILFSAVTETVSFALGAFVGMPAVRNFAVYAAGAVFINALLQVTMFVSVLTLNQIRKEDSRADCFPCLQVKGARLYLDGSSLNGHASRFYEEAEEGFLQTFITKRYAPWLLGKKVKALVVMAFLAFFAAGVALLPEIQLGLDQRVAIPDDSYLIGYFNDLYAYLDTGPPVYFVARGVNMTQREHQQQMCARFTTCLPLSLPNVLEQERKRPEVSYISSPTASWIDDFFQWLKPENEACCRENGKTCFSGRQPAWNITLSGMPEGDEFLHYLAKFLAAPTDEDCPLGGQAAYGDAVAMDGRDGRHGTVAASHFRTTHKPLRSQDDFIKAYASARRIADDVTASTGVHVFPYSVFYVFFDQYAGIVRLTATLLSAAVAMIFVVSAVLLGSPRTALVVALTVVMALVDIMGAMALMGVSLNAVSLVNLIICVGIAVEFCAHVARAFTFPSRALLDGAARAGPTSSLRGRDARACAALANVGASVFSGITITKVLGVSVLAFTSSKIFEVYYFRVWVALVVSAAAHALVFLPVALSAAGSRHGYVDPGGDGALEDDLVSRRYRAVRGRAAGGEEEEDEDDDSDGNSDRDEY